MKGKSSQKPAFAQKAWESSIQVKEQRRPAFLTDWGTEVPRLLRPRGDETETYAEKLGFPGEYPFTRGVYPSMYRGRFWTMRQYAGFGSAEQSNRRYRYLLEQGQTGLSVAFDLPTQIGYDSDHPMAQGEVGKVGVAISSLADMEILFSGIELQKVSTSMTINATAAILLALYVAVARKQNADLKKLSGTIQNDILKEYIARGTYIYPPRPSMRLITDIFGWCKTNLPSWNTISISGYHIREAGSTAVQEVAFSLANGCAYVQAAVSSGLRVDDFGPRLAFFFNAHNNFLEEVAKFRAARRLWAKLMKERFGAQDPRSMMLRFHTQTAGSTLTAQQPENNIVRVALQAMAAVLGGTQSLHTNAMDEALALPSEKAARIALRTQQIIAHESGVTDTVDPLAGSYYIEHLTDEIEAEAQKLLDKIESMGGAVSAIEKGFFQREIAAQAYKTQRAVDAKEKVIVGVNSLKLDEPSHLELLKVDQTIVDQQITRLHKFRAERDNDSVKQALDHLRQGAAGSQNLMPSILHAVENRATLGEISDALRRCWGEYRGEAA